MLTIFTVPKPFAGHIGLIQRNAIRSWKFLRPECEIFLCGNTPDVAAAAAELGVTCLSDIPCTPFGTPLLDSVFRLVAARARHRLLCFVNADIILLDDFVRAVQAVTLKRFLMVGQRWDIDIRFAIDFADPHWPARLREYVARHGELHPPAGSDYFVFPKGHGTELLPPFAVGRAAWDNWMIFNARRRGVPVIDASPAMTVIHQNHDYKHVPQGDGTSCDGVESNENLRLLGSGYRTHTLVDVTHLLGPGGVRRAVGWRYLSRRLDVFLDKYLWFFPVHRLYHRLLARRPKTGLLRLSKWLLTSASTKKGHSAAAGQRADALSCAGTSSPVQSDARTSAA
jgi:hypothetical protein